MVEIYKNDTLVMKFLVTEKRLKKTLSYSLKDNSKSINIDIFKKKKKWYGWYKIFFCKTIFVKYKKIKHKRKDNLQKMIKK